MSESIASDSTFYICFASDLKRKDWLYKFVKTVKSYLKNKKALEENKKIFEEIIVEESKKKQLGLFESLGEL